MPGRAAYHHRRSRGGLAIQIECYGPSCSVQIISARGGRSSPNICDTRWPSRRASARLPPGFPCQKHSDMAGWSSIYGPGAIERVCLFPVGTAPVGAVQHLCEYWHRRPVSRPAHHSSRQRVRRPDPAHDGRSVARRMPGGLWLGSRRHFAERNHGLTHTLSGRLIPSGGLRLNDAPWSRHSENQQHVSRCNVRRRSWEGLMARSRR